MAVCPAERRDASRLLTGLKTRRWAQGDHAHGLSGCGITPPQRVPSSAAVPMARANSAGSRFYQV